MGQIANEPWRKSCLHVYTGDGKGKTTAALGLAFRAAGRGMKTFFGQFMKGTFYGELESASRMDGLIVMEQFGTAECIPWRETPDKEDIDAAQSGLARCKEILLGGEFNLVVLDEINVAVHFRLLSVKDLLDLLDLAREGVEVVCTGRGAPEALLERADLVTEMNCMKHPYELIGLEARDGIER